MQRKRALGPSGQMNQRRLHPSWITILIRPPQAMFGTHRFHRTHDLVDDEPAPWLVKWRRSAMNGVPSFIIKHLSGSKLLQNARSG